MKAIYLTAYGNPAQNLKMVEVSEPNAPQSNTPSVAARFYWISITRTRNEQRCYRKER
jgi:hypothetical protein